MDGFQKRTKLKQNRILEAALQLFSLFGIKKVSISEIAKKAEVSQVTIYNYFESKDNLIHQTLVYYIEKTYQKYQDIINRNTSFPEKIENIIFNKVDIAGSIHQEIYQYLMKDFADGQSYLETIYQEKSIPFFQQLIAQGKTEGYIQKEISEEAIMFYIHMMKEHMQKEELNDYLLPITEDIMHLFFYGIMGKKE
ncbi:TetR/AcrR family transcriptional regulator [Gracilibacillus kekensis]|uniref:Transcriptional regulator, TetR family n=1 Tax=Gracilibacillus kekensis TaxID=1027249 RepID=A0A1M7QAU1_9BACI|nr:TetR/AcrR family transcriptional regulator [Gracilibacillus kekensis]SHN27865.1 transcriptional regulator, TetR family [Gracilibacillus kekensis]